MATAARYLEIVQMACRFDGEIDLSPHGMNTVQCCGPDGDADSDTMFYVGVDVGDDSVEAYVIVSKEGKHTFAAEHGRIVVIDDVIIHASYEMYNTDPEQFRDAYEQIIVDFELESSNYNKPGACSAIRTLLLSTI